MNSSQLKSYLTGLILGDGSIDKGVQKRAFRIRCINKDFIEKIYKDVTETTNFKVHFLSHAGNIDKNGVNHKDNWEVYIEAHPYFAKKYHQFYDDYRGRKIETSVLETLDWNGWANWWMSDGYIVRVGLESGNIKDRRAQLCTDRYPLPDIERLQNYLYKLGLDTTIIKRNKFYRLNIRLCSAQHFFLNINPFVVPSMKYKLNLCYAYQPTWMSNEYYALMQSINTVPDTLTKE